MKYGAVAQVVEHQTENLSVGSSTLPRTTEYVGLAEWLGPGLQNQLHRFESGTRLKQIKDNVLWVQTGQNDLLKEYLWNEWRYNVHKRYLKYFEQWYDNITESQRQFFEAYRKGNKTLQFIEIYLVVNQLD